MEFIFYAVIFVFSVLAIAGFVQSLFYPPVDIEPAELPTAVRDEWTSCFSDFAAEQIQFIQLRNRYTLIGKYQSRPCRLKFDLTPDGELAEVDFKDLSGTRVFKKSLTISSSDIPRPILNVMEPFFKADSNEMSPGETCVGMIGAENAYQVKVFSSTYEYEFEITESGRIVEFEKENRT